MAACLFCEIIAGREPGTIVYRDDRIVALRPPEPKSRVHLLLLPRRHITSADALRSEDAPLWMHLLQVARKLARTSGIDVQEMVYHLGTNAGRDDIRELPHLHVWLMDGSRD